MICNLDIVCAFLEQFVDNTEVHVIMSLETATSHTHATTILAHNNETQSHILDILEIWR